MEMLMIWVCFSELVLTKVRSMLLWAQQSLTQVMGVLLYMIVLYWKLGNAAVE